MTDNKSYTKYPVLLVHGSNCRDFAPARYWGRIPKALKKCGVTVFLGGQDAWGSIEDNAGTVKKTILKIVKQTGCKKVNIIAHSKGGLEARYMIQKLGMASYVASLTTIATPHKGVLAVDRIFFQLPFFLQKTISFFIDCFWRLLGDENPDFFKGFGQLSVSYCRRFNREIKNNPSIYYQSYASVMKSYKDDLFLAPTYFLIGKLEGYNDGLVCADSARWGQFRGVINGKKPYGISHRDSVDFCGKERNGFSAVKLYLSIVKELKEKGY